MSIHFLIVVSLVASALSAVAGIVGLWSSSGDWEEPLVERGHTFVTSSPQRFNRTHVYTIGRGVSPRPSPGGKR